MGHQLRDNRFRASRCVGNHNLHEGVQTCSLLFPWVVASIIMNVSFCPGWMGRRGVEVGFEPHYLNCFIS